jgi:predicted MPP superfamily phosphohydrolase
MTINEKIILAGFLLAFGSLYILEFSLVVVYAFNKLRRNKDSVKILLTKPALCIHSLAVLGIICFLYSYFIEPYRLEVKMVPLKTDKLKQTSFRIVHISDLHCSGKQRNEKKMVQIINGLQPDVIVFTGDAVNKPSALPTFKDSIRSLNASIGKFAVYGNWDVWHFRGLDYYGDTGFELLDAKTVTLTKNGETITVSGLSCENPQSLPDVTKKLSAESFNIFLYHYCDLVEDLDGFNVDLYLCGHTHGGQVVLPFYGALITLSKFGKKYESGMYSVGKTTLYVNRGIGLDAAPAPQVRFLARPEITVFNIGPKG